MERQQDKTVKAVINLKAVEDKIPRNEVGDPAFQFLRIADDQRAINGNPVAIMDLFTPEQVIALVNRQLYQMEYQFASHKRRYAEEKEQRELIKRALKMVAPGVSLAKATDDQLKQAAVVALKIQKGEL